MTKLIQINIAASNERIAPFAERLPHIVSLIEGNAADIITVQAGLDRSGSDTPIDALTARLPAMPHVARAGGLALIARQPIDEARAVPLRHLGHPDDPFERQLLIVRLSNLATAVAVAHLSWVGVQAEANIADALGALSGMAELVLAGDFNQPPESPALGQLTTAGFVDPWTRLRPDEAGYTYPMGAPASRIDYVLERGERPLIGAIDLIEGDLSDHAALIAEIHR